jgi:hypothetical protein
MLAKSSPLALNTCFAVAGQNQATGQGSVQHKQRRLSAASDNPETVVIARIAPMRLQSLVHRGLVSERVAQDFRVGDDDATTRRDPALSAYLGSTSNDGKSLSADDGGVRGNKGAIRGGHIDDAKPRKGSGFTNPENDYGPANFGPKHIDSGTTRRRDPQEARMKSDRNKLMGIDAARDGNFPSAERARRSSANEYYPDSWYGEPPGRQ